ncbi:MAG: acetyltransferase [Erysipelotrichaceae bacterium]
MKKQVILLGAGGHCKSIIDSIKSMKCYDIIGILDIEENIGEYIENIQIIGKDEDLCKYYNYEENYFFISIGSIGDYSLRKQVIEKANKTKLESINVIDATAIIAETVKIGKGVFIGKNCVINANTIIGDYAIINTGAIIEHDCKIDSFVHIAPASVIAGNCHIGYGTHIGMNSTVLQNLNIGNNCLIGAGSIVLGDIKDNNKAFGIIKEVSNE